MLTIFNVGTNTKFHQNLISSIKASAQTNVQLWIWLTHPLHTKHRYLTLQGHNQHVCFRYGRYDVQIWARKPDILLSFLAVFSPCHLSPLPTDSMG